MQDDFEIHLAGLTSPAGSDEVIRPNDSADLTYATRALFVGGDVVQRMISGEDVTFTDMQAGVIYPLRAVRVLDTGTTASGLVSLR